MTKLRIIALVAAATTFPFVFAQRSTPDSIEIAKLEAKIKPIDISRDPSEPKNDLAKYARYYFEYTKNSERLIVGEFLRGGMSGKPPGIYFVHSEKEFPIIYDGGCSVIHVVYSATKERIVSLECNGYA
jgi:hypothetical protein